MIVMQDDRCQRVASFGLCCGIITAPLLFSHPGSARVTARSYSESAIVLVSGRAVISVSTPLVHFCRQPGRDPLRINQPKQPEQCRAAVRWKCSTSPVGFCRTKKEDDAFAFPLPAPSVLLECLRLACGRKARDRTILSKHEWIWSSDSNEREREMTKLF